MTWQNFFCALQPSAFIGFALGSILVCVTPTEAEDPGTGLGLLEAVVMTLEHDPNLKIEATRPTTARGGLMIAASDFDPGFTADLTRVDRKNATGEDTFSDDESWNQTFGWNQTLRSGLVLQPRVVLDRTDGAGGVPATNTATVTFTLRQPLMRGRDPEVVTADERAAELELMASRYTLAHQVASRLQTVVRQYWAVRSAMLDMEILRSTEASSRTLLENNRKLVEADVTPPAELVQLEADLTSREADRIDGERRLFSAMQRLGLEIGLDSEESLRLPEPDEPLPGAVTVASSAAELIDLAHARRADLRAANERLHAAEIVLAASEDALRPRLDLVAAPRWSGFVDGDGLEDFYTPIFDNVPGLGASLTLSYALPVGNQLAEGQLLQQQASIDRQALALDQSHQAISAEVAIAHDAVVRAVERLDRLDRAVVLFEKTLENEEKKLGAGLATLLDVLNQRDRLVSARQRRAGAQTDLALALVDLRFQTGTLISVDDAVDDDGLLIRRSVRLDALLTPPEP
ncbi:MAG: TolC family protein [Acidobacteriota bacterium]